MSAYSDLILSHSPTVYYRLGEGSGTTLVDSGPNSLNGTHSATGNSWGTGAIANEADQAITFDGVNNLTQRTDHAAIDLGDGPFSLECWVKRSSTQGATQHLIGRATTGAYLLLFNTSNRPQLGALSVGSVVESTTAITDTNWHHIVACKDANTVRKIYVDGVDVSGTTTDQTLVDGTTAFRIGVVTARFPGSMDEVALYKAVLTPAQVLQHYNVGRGIIGQATETDSVTSLSRSKQKAVAQVTQTDLSQAMGRAKAKAFTQSTEADESTALSTAKAKAAGQASETDEAQPIASGETFPVTQATETDLAQALSASKQVTLGQASETDLAQSVTRQGVVATATETDEALPITVQAGTTPTPALGGWAAGRRIVPQKRQAVLVATAQETDDALPFSAVQTPSRIQIEDDELLLLV